MLSSDVLLCTYASDDEVESLVGAYVPVSSRDVKLWLASQPRQEDGKSASLATAPA